jgi:hypothetical protein
MPAPIPLVLPTPVTRATGRRVDAWGSADDSLLIQCLSVAKLIHTLSKTDSSHDITHRLGDG